MNIVVIGGGAAGMLAALSAKTENRDANVFLLEKNEKLGKKIFISGKGRGNCTNKKPISAFPEMFHHNPRFLYSAFQCFSNEDLIRLLEENGCRLKVERGDRVFPVSDHAYSITDALKHALRKADVHIAYNTTVRSIETERIYDTESSAIGSGTGQSAEAACEMREKTSRKAEIKEKKRSRGKGKLLRVCGVKTERESYRAERVIICTGGLAYPSTGSTGDGYRFAARLGHHIVPCVPSLTYLSLEEEDFFPLRGLKCKNVSLRVTEEGGKEAFSAFGELHFTEKGIGGPLGLKASAVLSASLNAADLRDRRIYTLHIDLKPALEHAELSKRIQRACEELKGEPVHRMLPGLLPRPLQSVFSGRLERQGVKLAKKSSELSRQEREALTTLLKDFCFTIRGSGSFSEAIVTQGGVSVREVSPKTMESKLVQGLYFAGELLDIDADTGGYNMQAAFSTGALAGRSAAGKGE